MQDSVKQAKYNLVYEIKNLINDKIYVGAHSTDNINDCYMGSGKLIQKAIKKYGCENFTKTIICFCESSEEMFKKEAEIVNVEFVKREDTYNLHVGGSGVKIGNTPTEESRKKMSLSKLGKKLSQEHKDKIGAAHKGRVFSEETIVKMRESHVNQVGVKHTEEAKARISDSKRGHIVSEVVRCKIRKTLSGRKLSDEHRKNIASGNIGRVVTEDTRLKIGRINKGKKMSEEQKKKISETKKRRFLEKKLLLSNQLPSEGVLTLIPQVGDHNLCLKTLQ